MTWTLQKNDITQSETNVTTTENVITIKNIVKMAEKDVITANINSGRGWKDVNFAQDSKITDFHKFQCIIISNERVANYVKTINTNETIMWEQSIVKNDVQTSR